MGGGTLFGEEEGSGDWSKPVGIVPFWEAHRRHTLSLHTVHPLLLDTTRVITVATAGAEIPGEELC